MLTAAEILARTAETYAICKTYADTSEDSTVMIRGPKPWERTTSRNVSRSAFERGGRFFFDGRAVAVGPESEWKYAVAWSDGATVRIWSTLDPSVSEKLTLHDALGAVFGLSRATASFAAALLVPGTAKHRPIPMADSARVVGECEIDGRRCVRIEGVTSHEQQLTLAIDIESFLVRGRESGHVFDEGWRQKQAAMLRDSLALLGTDDKRREAALKGAALFEERPAQDFRTESTTVWHPRIDMAIELSALKFEPPG